MGKESEKEWIYVCVYWIPVLYTWKKHNIVNLPQYKVKIKLKISTEFFLKKKMGDNLKSHQLCSTISNLCLSFHICYLDTTIGYAWCFPGGSDGEKSTCNIVDTSSIPGLGRSLVERMPTHASILA